MDPLLIITNICKKIRKILGLIYRQFYSFSDPTTLISLYTSLVRSHLEYLCTVWDPHLKREIEELESVQKFALRMCSKRWRESYSTLLLLTEIPTLATQRSELKLCYFLPYSIITRSTPNFPTQFRH